MQIDAAQLKRFDLTVVGRGPWVVVPDLPNRAIRVHNKSSGYSHKVYYGTRTKRTLEEAEQQATAMCAILNAFKAKRP